MIDRLLIANRGEIACRIAATARRLGIHTVAVHSDADAGARHVAIADEAVRIGPAPAAESYLQAETLIAAATARGCDAVHPGYGFLSESPAFADAVEAAGLTFVGPPAAAIRAMGLKDAAKTAMEKAGVPVVPGYHGEDQDADMLAAEAERIGYPVLIKARAGGGGKGMRLVERPGDFSAGLQAAQNEGRASFGDPAVLVEKYVATPRHVEIQVFADAHGNAIHLFERDCSLQRRHQKVIEEAPAPGITEAVRRAMGEAAVEAARAIGYRGAGTVEFIADGSQGLRADGFWFMEMNTRLQVEHPVTEAITGLDLVEWQLRVAAGEALPMTQDELVPNGHAIEARLYAEDAARGFLPATGTLERLGFPEGTAFARGPVRIDSGVREGDTISPYYDPMIAKIITHGPDRASALRRLRRALAATEVAGTVTNLGFLAALTRQAEFASGDVDTGLIGRHLDALTARPEAPAFAPAVAVLALSGLLDPPAGDDPWTQLRNYRHWEPASLHAALDHDGARMDVYLSALGADRWQLGAHAYRIRPEHGRIAVQEGDWRTTLRYALHGGSVTLFTDEAAHTYSWVDPIARAAEAMSGGDAVLAPMPGTVTRVDAAPGQQVAEGEALIVMEAMKMEQTLTAPRDGTVAEVMVRSGAQVSDGDVLVALEPEDG